MLSVVLLILLLSTMTLLPVSGSGPGIMKTSCKSLYVKAQYAGNLGLASVGIGNEFFNNKLSTDLNYGYMPDFLNGVRVHTFAIKPAFHFKEQTISGFKAGCYIGTSVNYYVTSNTYIIFPHYYPEGYYLSNAIHSNPFIGGRISFPAKNRKSGRLSVYSELGTVDFKILCAVKNRKIEFDEIWNLCFGIVFHINKT